MKYYHGSGELFNQFDISKSKGYGIHLTPHYNYAKNFAINGKDRTGYGYIYTVEVIGIGSVDNMVYHKHLSNAMFGGSHISSTLKIVNIELL